MNHSLARLLTRLYPRPWRKRYGAEFETLLQSNKGGLRTLADVVWSAICEHIFPTGGLNMHADLNPSRLQSWCARAPWAIFGLAPLSLLAGAYFVACLILWSGWKIFLPGTDTPFVPIDGFAVLYFGVGRLLYYSAPILVGWAIGLIASRQRLKAVWPAIGFILLALAGTSAQVHASRPDSNAAGQISMHFAFGNSAQGVAEGLTRALVIFSLIALPYLIGRLRRSPSRPA